MKRWKRLRRWWRRFRNPWPVWIEPTPREHERLTLYKAGYDDNGEPRPGAAAAVARERWAWNLSTPVRKETHA